MMVTGSTTTMAGWMNRAVAWCWWSSSFGLNNHQNSRTLLCPLAAASSSSSRRRRQQQRQQQPKQQQQQQPKQQQPKQLPHQRQISYSVVTAPLKQSPLLVPQSTKSIDSGGGGKRMAKSSSKKFYAVARGRRVGIFDSWKECASQVNGFKMARFKAFPTHQEAASFLQMNADSGGGSGAAVLPLSLSSSSLPSSSSFHSLERRDRDSRGHPSGASDGAVHHHQHRQTFLTGEGTLDAIHFGSSREDEAPSPMVGANVDGPSSQSGAGRPKAPSRATIVNPYQKSAHKVPPRKKAEAARGSRRKHSLHDRGGEARPSPATAKKLAGSAAADSGKKPDSAAAAPLPPPRRKLTIHINFDGGSRGNPGLAGGTYREDAE
jgi:Caulimovirus viroplasmin